MDRLSRLAGSELVRLELFECKRPHTPLFGVRSELPDLVIVFGQLIIIGKIIIEPVLHKRLAELDIDESTAARVRSALTELLPDVACSIEDVAEKIGMSKRTLQRKLSEENTTFQKQLTKSNSIVLQIAEMH